MLPKSWLSIPLLAIVLALLVAVVPQSSVGQTSRTRSDSVQLSAAPEKQPPFDKLELFAFFAAGPVNNYVTYIIQERGANFTPDSTFISSFSNLSKRAILSSVKPRFPHTAAPDRDHAYDLLRSAYEAQQTRRFVSAGEIYQQALQLAPDSACLHLAYAAELMLSHDFAHSDEQARLSLKLWPSNAEAHAMLALSMTLQKRPAEAEAESREALRLFPQHMSAQFTLAHSLINQRKYQEALPAIRQAMASWPAMAALTKFLGIALLETGDTAGGATQLSSYVKLDPTDAEGHYYLGAALRQQGDSAGAHAQFLEAARLAPNVPLYATAAHPDSPAAPEEPANGPKPEDGTVSGNTYTNNFFGFTFEFPKGWTVLSSGAARSMVEIGGAMLSGGDPTEQDLMKAGQRQAHPLLFVMQGAVANQPISYKEIQITALDVRSAPQLTAESYLQTAAQILRASRGAIEASAPEKCSIANREFWKTQLAIQTAGGTRYSSEFALVEKGYLLLFLFGVSDPTGLGEIEKSLNSLRFLNNPN